MKTLNNLPLILTSISRPIALATLIATITGCAGFSANKLAPVSPDSLVSHSGEKVNVLSRWKAESRSVFSNKSAFAAKQKKQFEAVLDATQCCMIVESPEDATITIDAIAYDEVSRAAYIPAVITGLSGYVIPSWVTFPTHFSAQVSNGSKSSTYELTDSFTLVQWLPMLLAAPFANPFRIEKEVSNNVFSVFISKMRADGFLSATRDELHGQGPN